MKGAYWVETRIANTVMLMNRTLRLTELLVKLMLCVSRLTHMSCSHRPQTFTLQSLQSIMQNFDVSIETSAFKVFPEEAHPKKMAINNKNYRVNKILGRTIVGNFVKSLNIQWFKTVMGIQSRIYQIIFTSLLFSIPNNLVSSYKQLLFKHPYPFISLWLPSHHQDFRFWING